MTGQVLHLEQQEGILEVRIVWIDEMEKGLSHGGLDSGTRTRVLGTILTWMQEKSAPCVAVATANDIGALPPELLRKGGFA